MLVQLLPKQMFSDKWFRATSQGFTLSGDGKYQSQSRSHRQKVDRAVAMTIFIVKAKSSILQSLSLFLLQTMLSDLDLHTWCLKGASQCTGPIWTPLAPA